MNASKNHLLGFGFHNQFKSSASKRTAQLQPQLQPQPQSRLNPNITQGRRPRNREDEDLSDAILAPQFYEYQWSKLNQKLVKMTLYNGVHQHSSSTASSVPNRRVKESISISRSTACHLRQHFKPQCTLHIGRAKLYENLCFQNQTQILQADQGQTLDYPWSTLTQQTALGLKALHKQEYTTALKYCQPLAHTHPHHVASLCVGLALAYQKKDQQALQYLRAYLYQHPSHIQARLALAKSIGRLNDHKSAVSLLKTGLKLEKNWDLDPIVPLNSNQWKGRHQTFKNRLLYNLGVGYTRLNQIDLAVQSWKQIPPNTLFHREAQNALETLSATLSSKSDLSSP